jgi:uncharacterized protein (DUF2252 family)
VRLHGDPHVEQFAVSADAWGLEDFDDSARGPAIIDIVRFLGSIALVTRQRGWTGHRDALFKRFFAGYQRGLSSPDYQPPTPDLVRYLRADVAARVFGVGRDQDGADGRRFDQGRRHRDGDLLPVDAQARNFTSRTWSSARKS